jgi:hypothetical protein
MSLTTPDYSVLSGMRRCEYIVEEIVSAGNSTTQDKPQVSYQLLPLV